MEKVVITKIDKEEASTPKPPTATLSSKLDGGKKRRTLKTYPRGILKTAKIKPVSDPAKHPPFKRGSKKHTVRLLSDSAITQRRKTIKKKISKMSDSKVRDVAIKAGLSKGNAPPKLLREIVEGGMIAGFISSE
jgi:hypothetical protein